MTPSVISIRPESSHKATENLSRRAIPWALDHFQVRPASMLPQAGVFNFLTLAGELPS
jgi:hypothetical protein